MYFLSRIGFTRSQWVAVGLGVIPLCAIALGGCAGTLQGARQDVSRDTHAVAQVAHNAAAETSAVAHNAGAALSLTPRIKTAIIRDPVLDDKRNKINVDSTNKEVRLSGHVMTADMKRRAEEDAQKVLSDHHSVQTIKNELTVQ